jgi:hypothetical protein
VRTPQHPEELDNFKRGAALKRSTCSRCSPTTPRPRIAQSWSLFRHHQDETREQIANLEQAFAAFGCDVDDSPYPAIEGIEKEGKANVKKTDDAVRRRRAALRRGRDRAP